MPAGDVHRELKDLIYYLSEKYSSPKFDPHVTLMGRVVGFEDDIIYRTSQLAAAIKPYKIEFSKVEYLDQYFRCLFTRVNETDDVMGANYAAREIFARMADPKYMPHLSLLYGNFTSIIKEEIIAEIGKRLDLFFEARDIHLFSTDSEPRDWHRIKEFALKSTS